MREERELASGTVDYETATRCPRCDIPGQVVSKLPATSGRPGTVVHVVFCRNQACVWCDSSWIVQVNRDGTIPVRASGGVKSFPDLPQTGDPTARAIATVARQLRAETEVGSEIANPNSPR